MSGFNTPALLFGLILLVASIGLFLFGRLKPELQRDSDNVYAIIGVVCSLILFASAFDLSLGMSFQQLLMIGSLIALMWENIQSRQPRAMAPRRGGGGAFDNFRRGAGSDPGRRNGPMDSRSQGVYRYEAELDNYDRFDAPPRRDQRRIRGSEPQGYGDRYDERSRDPDRDRPGRAEFDDRPRRPGPERGPERGSERGPRRNSDWEDDFAAGPRSPRDGFGPERGPGRGRGPNNARPPRDDRSMEGRPIGGSGGNGGGGRPPEPSGSGRLTGEGRPFVEDRPPEDRPPIDMPPRRRPRPETPSDRPPIGGPIGGPMDRLNGGDRSSRRPPGADRPIIDAAPAAAGARPLEPLSEKPRGQAAAGRPPGGPSRRPNAPQDDGYVDFKPVAPPPDDEFDNSSQFDD